MSITYILGISCYYHDSAAAIVKQSPDSVSIVAAAQEERFTRIKNDEKFPVQSIAFCLKKAGISLDQVSQVVYYEKPWLSFERIFETHLALAPKGLSNFLSSMPLWLGGKFNTRKILRKELAKISKTAKPEILFSYHHLSHAASAFFPSPFSDAAVLCLDGVGEWATTSSWIGEQNQASASLTPLWEIHFPHSLGLLYSAFTSFCGFKVNSGEYKLMGLAPYGKPKYVQTIKDHLIEIADDGAYKLNLDYLAYLTEMKMTNAKFAELFQTKARAPESKMSQIYMDLAASIQLVTEEVILKLCRSLREQTGKENLCLAGGVALNCVANGKILRENIFKNLWIQPAAGDAGGALGAALLIAHQHNRAPRKFSPQDQMQASLLGPEFSQQEIEGAIQKLGLRWEVFAEDEMIPQAAKLLAEQKVLAWFHGRLEFGPRALGARSILADPRDPSMQHNVNMKIKFREGFRPFAPIVPLEKMSAYFELPVESPYMLLVAPVRKEFCLPERKFPAITHVDSSARVQSVDEDRHPLLARLLQEFGSLTGHPVLLNTSFNIRGEPIVCSPLEALQCFIQTDIDCIVMGNCLLKKSDQDSELLQKLRRQDWSSQFESD